jgi:hypothetical protein
MGDLGDSLTGFYYLSGIVVVPVGVGTHRSKSIRSWDISSIGDKSSKGRIIQSLRANVRGYIGRGHIVMASY